MSWVRGGGRAVGSHGLSQSYMGQYVWVWKWNLILDAFLWEQTSPKSQNST